MNTLWAIADLHLPLAIPTKDMALINSRWIDYVARLERNWRECVAPQDVVVLPGDISWAMRLEDAAVDLQWLDRLPGTKILMRGNHDYWWKSALKLKSALPPTCLAMTGEAIEIGSLALAGSRLWIDREIKIGEIFVKNEEVPPPLKDRDIDKNEQIFTRELARLERSLSTLSPRAKTRLAITHYPPIGTDLNPSRASCLMRRFGVQFALFGHLHNVCSNINPFGSSEGIKFELCASDHLGFCPKKILQF